MKISFDDTTQKLNAGQVVAIPTETVYGMAASIAFPSAIERIFALKGRPSTNPLIVHVSSKDEVIPFVETFPVGFLELAQHFWPGPMTLVLQVKEGTIPSTVR